MSDDRMVSKIRALLAKAEAVAGTPEADAFSERAFDLIAKYGITLTESTEGGPDPEAVVKLSIILPEAHAAARRDLMWAIAGAFKCSGVYSQHDRKLVLFGVRRNLARFKIVNTLVFPQMVNAAAHTIGANPFDKAATEEHRASFMAGFAASIRERIEASEHRVHLTSGHTRAVAFEDDYTRARKAQDAAYPHAVPGNYSQRNGSGYGAGSTAGAGTDVGQTAVNRAGQAAIGC